MKCYTAKGFFLMFKMCRAREEIQRLDVEIRRLVTYIRDEDKYLRQCEDQLKDANPALAHQIAIYRSARGRFNSRHLKRLHDISKLVGFSGTLAPGISTSVGPGESASVPNVQIPSQTPAECTALKNAVDPDTQDDLDDEEEEEEVAHQEKGFKLC